jgi:hypothetical protein
MARRYPKEVRTMGDYIRLIPRLRAAMGPHVGDLLRIGLAVVLDWPANTVASRLDAQPLRGGGRGPSPAWARCPGRALPGAAGGTQRRRRA